MVYCSDAGGSGYAVARAQLKEDERARACSVDERWRFRELGKQSAREEALSEESKTVECRQSGFDPLSFSFVGDGGGSINSIHRSLPTLGPFI